MITTMQNPNALFIYGTLAPNRPNHHIMAPIHGEWLPAYAFGELIADGWGASLGYPAIIPNDKGQRVDGFVFISDELPNHWARLDEFEGEGYCRVVIDVYHQTGEKMTAFVYALADKDVESLKANKGQMNAYCCP